MPYLAFTFPCQYTGVAQLVEHWSPKPGVGSSSLSTRAKKIRNVASLQTTFKESYDELVHKVTWPSWKQLQSSSILVLIASLIIAGIIFVMDYVFGVQVVEVGSDGFQWRGILGFIYDLLGDL